MDIKKKIIEILTTRDEYVSGTEIAEKFGITRMAVSRAVASLRDEGYTISSRNNCGYFLENDRGVIYPEKIEAATGLRTEYFPSIPSTNDRAKLLAAQGEDSGVTIARRQTAGRARHEKAFLSDVDGAYFTVRIKGKLPFGSAERISDAAVDAVAAFCGGERRENTVYRGRKKLCGVLTEAIADMDFIRYAIVGVGVYDSPDLPPKTELIIFVIKAALKKAAECSEKV